MFAAGLCQMAIKSGGWYVFWEYLWNVTTWLPVHSWFSRAHHIYSSSYDIAWATIVANHHEWDDETLQTWQHLFGEETLSINALSDDGVAFRNEAVGDDTLETQTTRIRTYDILRTNHPTATTTKPVLPEQSLSKSSSAMDVPYEESSEGSNTMMEESKIATNQKLVLGILLAIIVPCTVCIVIIVILVKGFHYFKRVLARHPLIFDTTVSLLILLIIVSQLSQRHRLMSETDEEEDDLTAGFITSKLNRGFLWITTPSFTIHVKPLMVSEQNIRNWVQSAFLGAQSYFRKLAVGFSGFSPWAKMREPPLEGGKCRVRWRCVSVFWVLLIGAAKEVNPSAVWS